jgi:hypothetical protein
MCWFCLSSLHVAVLVTSPRDCTATCPCLPLVASSLTTIGNVPPRSSFAPFACRYEHALTKANYASLALRGDGAAGEEEGGMDEDEDLYQSLNK